MSVESPFYKIVEQSDELLTLEFSQQLDANTVAFEMQSHAPEATNKFRQWWKQSGVLNSHVEPAQAGNTQFEPHILRLEHSHDSDQIELLGGVHDVLTTAHANRQLMERRIKSSRATS